MNTEQALDWFRNAVSDSRKFKESLEDKKDKTALEQQQLANIGGLERQGLVNKGQMGVQELQGRNEITQRYLANELAKPITESTVAENLSKTNYYNAGAEKTRVDALNEKWILDNIPDEAKKRAYYLRNPGVELNRNPNLPPAMPAVGTQTYDPVTLEPGEMRYAIPKQITTGATQAIATPAVQPQPAPGNFPGMPVQPIDLGGGMYKYFDENGVAHFTDKKREGSELYTPRAKF